MTELDNPTKTNLAEIQIAPKPVKLKRNGQPYKPMGGPRPNSGRPRRMDEQQIIEKLQPMADTAFRILHEKVAQGDMKAIQLYMQYFIGLPTQKVESKIEGQLNQVQIEVIKPNVQMLEEATN
jgi:hypothetical protein